MSNIQKQMQWDLYQLLLHIEYNPEYTAKQIKNEIANILADASDITKHQVLDTVKEEVENYERNILN